MGTAPLSQIEVVDPATVKLRGYPAIFGNEFDYFDWRTWKDRRFVIEPGAFTSVLAKLGNQPVDVYWSHESWRLQLGETSVLRQDSKGLYFESIPFATTEGIDRLTVIAGRSKTGASLSFEFGEIEEDENGLEHLLSFSAIYEVGPTPIGANPKAYTELVDLDDESESVEPAAEESADPEPITEEPEAAAEAGLTAAMWHAVARLRGSRF